MLWQDIFLKIYFLFLSSVKKTIYSQQKHVSVDDDAYLKGGITCCDVFTVELKSIQNIFV